MEGSSIGVHFDIQEYTYCMDSKKITWLLMFVGGTLGSYLPLLWGSGYFSLSSVFFSAIGAILGIWLGFKLTH